MVCRAGTGGLGSERLTRVGCSFGRKMAQDHPPPPPPLARCRTPLEPAGRVPKSPGSSERVSIQLGVGAIETPALETPEPGLICPKAASAEEEEALGRELVEDRHPEHHSCCWVQRQRQRVELGTPRTELEVKA